jgi:FAD/FMN-containing dehydrogenase
MKKMNPWNNIPKFKNTTILKIDNKLKIDFDSKTTYLARGEGRSYGDVCLNNDGTLIDTNKLKKILYFDESNGFIECEAGITLKELLEYLIPKGWFLPVVPGTSYVTLGGAIANDIHGKNHHKAGSFGNFVKSLNLLTSDKKVSLCSPDQNQDKFSATIGGLGLTGLIVSARIQLIKIESDLIYSKSIKFNSLDEFFELNEQLENTNEYTVSWIDVNLKTKNLRGIFHVGSHSKNTKYNQIKSKRRVSFTFPFVQRFSIVNNLTINLLNNFYFWINKNDNVKKQYYRSFFFPLDFIKNWNKAYGKKGFYQYQFVVPIKNSKTTLDQVIDLISFYNQRPVLSVLKTFGKIESKGLMSFPLCGLTLAMDFQNKGVKTLKMFSELDKIVLKNNGKIYIAKDSRMEKDSFKRFYPNFDEFSKFIDPNFNSSFLKRVI